MRAPRVFRGFSGVFIRGEPPNKKTTRQRTKQAIGEAADENSSALRGGFRPMKAQQDNTKKDDVFTFAGGLLKK